MNNTQLFQKILMIIPYIFNRGSSVSELELKQMFGLDRNALREIYGLTILLGYPPYSPNTFFDLYVDENDPEKIHLWVPLKNLLTLPVSFNIKEAFALISGYKLVARTLQNKKLEELIAKINTHLRETLNNDLAGVEHKIDFSVPSQGADKNIEAVDSATKDCRMIRMDYYSASKEKTSKRRIEPYLTINHFGKWYLVGYCEENKDYRSFRFDRIKNVSIEGEKFHPRTDFDAMKYIEADNFFFEDEEPSEFIELRFKKRAAKNIKHEFFNAELKTLPSGDVLAKLPLRNPAWILSSLRKFGADVLVVSPENFKMTMIAGYEKLLKNYDS
jgi:predicted DNA-binding transcriptional regulator YafY